MDMVVVILKWFTKIASIAILALVVFIVGAHVLGGFDFCYEMSNSEVKAAIGLIGMFLGIIVGLKWKLYGGLMSILAFTVFMLLEQSFKLNLVLTSVLIVGCLNILLYLVSRFRKR